MMAGLFAIYLFSLFFILRGKKRVAFALIIFNLALSAIMLLHHATDVLNIQI